MSHRKQCQDLFLLGIKNLSLGYVPERVGERMLVLGYLESMSHVILFTTLLNRSHHFLQKVNMHAGQVQLGEIKGQAVSALE